MTTHDTAPALIDIGINLSHDSFDADRDEVVSRARAAGVVQMIVTGSSAVSTRQALALAARKPGVLFATAGVHPHHAGDLDEQLLAQYAQLAADSQLVAIGECGLDYFRDYSPREVQRSAFHRQLELAERLGKPLFLHVRDAHQDFVSILREHPRALAQGAVAHCFTGTAAELASYLAMGLHVGITGWICDERRGAHLLPLMKSIPPGRLMIETDAPYLLPRNLPQRPQSRRNEPRFLLQVAATLAQARGESLVELAAHTTATARRFFALTAPPRIDEVTHEF